MVNCIRYLKRQYYRANTMSNSDYNIKYEFPDIRVDEIFV